MSHPTPLLSTESELKRFCPELIEDVRLQPVGQDASIAYIVPRLSVCRYLLASDQASERTVLEHRRVKLAIANCVSAFNRRFAQDGQRIHRGILLNADEMKHVALHAPGSNRLWALMARVRGELMLSRRRFDVPTGETYSLWAVPPA